MSWQIPDYSQTGVPGFGLPGNYIGNYPTNFAPLPGPGLTVQPTRQYGQTGLDWSNPTALGYSIATGHGPGMGTNPYTFPGVSGSYGGGGGDPFAGVTDFFGSLSTGAKWILLGGLGLIVFSYANKYRAQ